MRDIPAAETVLLLRDLQDDALHPDAHVREFTPLDGCAAFSDERRQTAIAALRPIARVLTVAEAMAELSGA